MTVRCTPAVAYIYASCNTNSITHPTPLHLNMSTNTLYKEIKKFSLPDNELSSTLSIMLKHEVTL